MSLMLIQLKGSPLLHLSDFTTDRSRLAPIAPTTNIVEENAKESNNIEKDIDNTKKSNNVKEDEKNIDKHRT